MSNHKCHDCGVTEGEMHKYGCDAEACPFCGNQLLGCDCSFVHLGYEFDREKMFMGLPEDVYENGISKEEEKQWIEILNNEGRVPFIIWPNICARCGKLWPEMFKVPDGVWEKYVQIGERGNMVCLSCFNEIRNLIDCAEKKER